MTADLTVRLRPVGEADLAMFRRFCTEPGLIGLDWAGFRDAAAPARRFAVDGYLGDDDGRLVVEVEPERVEVEPERAAAGIGTHPENVAEQRSLEKAGFQLDGVIRACEFRAGRWRDGYLYSRLRDDPPSAALAEALPA
ncbi:GNAT family N-acetyltransferase [Micromonospora tarensis]|uniref:GNAT family N-acetyltransferase n=1 Tax=Micromonospora tarensis TaxID=2806100 RepID=UPI00281534C4|nr:GNAT family protein [Micromonospora tarensis]